MGSSIHLDLKEMSIPSYAARLSHNPDKGVVGLPEQSDSERVKKAKFKKLTRYFKEAKNVVCLTGAGISTKAGIADFRGPNGVWTKEESSKGRSKKVKLEEVMDSSFEQAKPTTTHEILAMLHSDKRLSAVISQNVDGLHLRSGLARDALIELHGNVFMEKCIKCTFEIFHDKDIGGIGCKPTGRKCTKCDGAMHDTVLDWDTPIEDELIERAEGLVANADLIICLGTSLRIVPAAELPLLVGTRRVDDIEPRICIVNLQATPLDSRADLVIRRDVDEVMQFLYDSLKDD